MAKENLIGTTFASKFAVTGFLGEGGMGRIYLADEVGANRQVALKVLHQHLGGESEVTTRFLREMKAAESVQHPNSVRVYEYGDHDGRLFLSMEFIDGDSLSEVMLDDGPMPPQRVAHIGRQIAGALGAAHAMGIIHRDLKPDNVMLAEAGAKDLVKVCDFGLARFMDNTDDLGPGEDDSEDEGDFHTAIGVRVGTPHYMAPEYIEHYHMDHRGDLYALGVLMYEMATGSPPFDGRPYEVFEAHTSAVPEPPSKRNPEVPDWLDAVILKLLQKQPADRYQIAEEVLVKLERDRGETLEDDRPSAKLEPITPRRTSFHDADDETLETERADLPSSGGGSRTVILAVVAAIALALAFGGLALLLLVAGGALLVAW